MLNLELLKNGTYQVSFGAWSTNMTFPELDALREQINTFVSDETSRMLNEDLMGDFTCDGCMI